MAEVRLQTYWCDSDPAGIVYFANFFRLVDQAEEELFRQSAAHRQQLLDSYSVWMPRVEAHVNYVRPIRSGSAIRVRIDPRFKGEKTVRFEFEIIDDETEASHASGYMTVVCVDRATFKATSIPAEIRNAIRGSEQ
jgi:YbgC/YbaW family acyl-CoA thioester hydrolase